MSSQHERELRRTVAEGLNALNDHNGGRYMSVVARTLGVDRTTVSRWRGQQTTASVEHCRDLADAYPDFFSQPHLVELHARAALNVTSSSEPVTIGAEVADGSAAVFAAATRALLADPGLPENRVFKLASLHLERKGIDALTSDPFIDDAAVEQTQQFREAMIARAAQGWRVRIVVSTASAIRVDAIWSLVQAIDGPDVEIKAYPVALPHVISAILIGNREVLLSTDSPRFERPERGLTLRSRSVVKWADDYFEDLHQAAPFTIRSVHGSAPNELDALRRHIAARPS